MAEDDRLKRLVYKVLSLTSEDGTRPKRWTCLLETSTVTDWTEDLVKGDGPGPDGDRDKGWSGVSKDEPKSRVWVVMTTGSVRRSLPFPEKTEVTSKDLHYLHPRLR